MRILVTTPLAQRDGRAPDLDLESKHHTVRLTANGCTYEVAIRHGQLEIRGIDTTLKLEPVGANCVSIAPGRPI